jgi:CubicO group peptidase (beta-lactamase class C family)
MDDESLTSALTEFLRRHRVPGAQLAVHHDGRTLAAHAGEVTAGSGQPVAADTAFPLGSLTKPFTAALVLALAGDGDLDLDRSLAAQLPELPGATDSRVTARQLLTHTSGLVSVPEDEERPDELGGAESLVHPPGEVFSYSNAGYFLAGRIAATITRMTWAEAVDAIVLRPLDIAPAFVAGVHSVGRSTATGHAAAGPDSPPRPVPEQSLAPYEIPAGALALSALDLVRFGRSRIAVSEGSTGEFRDHLGAARVEPFGMADGWGLGWAAYQRGDRRWSGHDGSVDGTSCHLRVEPGSGTVVALTANADGGRAVWQDVLALLRAAGIEVGDYPFRTLPGASPAAPPPGCAGRYANGGAGITVDTGDDGRLRVSTQGVPVSVVTCYDAHRFTVGGLASGGVAYVGRFLLEPRRGAVELIQVGGRTARKSGGGRA